MSKHSVGLIIFNVIAGLAFICVVVFCFENLSVYIKVCYCVYAVIMCSLFTANIIREGKRDEQDRLEYNRIRKIIEELLEEQDQ